MTLFSQSRDSFDLEEEVARLRKEVHDLTKSLSKQGRSAYRGARDEAVDLYGEVFDRLAAAMPIVRRQARSVENTIKDNPGQTAAVVGLAALCVAAAVLLARS